MKAPHFWKGGLDPYAREAAPLTRALLTPVAAIYACAVQRKIARTRPITASIPVICIGNLTLGGTGKTPVVAAIRDRLTQYGRRAATLSRGYKGRLTGPVKVNPSVHGARDVGDEPRMLAETGESWIGVDRPAAAEAMARDGVEVIIMDDGHQNPSLSKDLSMVVVDAGDPFGNGHVCPKGPLRETISAGLSRADAVILAGSGEDLTFPDNLPVLRSELKAEAAVPEGPLVAFAGIGRPEKFFDSLTAAGADISESVPYPDHHPYTDRDIAWLKTLASERDAALITTQKDFIRLSTRQRTDIAAWPVRAVINPAEQLDQLLLSALENHPDG